MTSTKDKIVIMQASDDDEPIETRRILRAAELGERAWGVLAPAGPEWDWVNFEYRIQQTKPSIDWSHVSLTYKYLVMDFDKIPRLFCFRPVFTKGPNGHWERSTGDGGSTVNPYAFASFKPGNCESEYSLHPRPGCEEQPL